MPAVGVVAYYTMFGMDVDPNEILEGLKGPSDFEVPTLVPIAPLLMHLSCAQLSCVIPCCLSCCFFWGWCCFLYCRFCFSAVGFPSIFRLRVRSCSTTTFSFAITSTLSSTSTATHPLNNKQTNPSHSETSRLQDPTSLL